MLFICDNSLFLETLQVGGVHSDILHGSSHLPSGEASPVPAQHIVHPPGHGLIAVTGHLAALLFILQLNKGRKGLMNLWSTCRSTSLPLPIIVKTSPLSVHLPGQPLTTKRKISPRELTRRKYSRKGREINVYMISRVSHQIKFT